MTSALRVSVQAIPGMLMALILSFDQWKERDEPKAAGSQHRYFRQAVVGYAVGLVTALAAGVLTRSAQPALLYLVSFSVYLSFSVRFWSRLVIYFTIIL
jgi:hypothetical protein